MKKNERKELKEKLLTAIKKVIHDNKADLTNKAEKAFKKSIKQIVKKTNKNRNSTELKNKKIRLKSDTVKLNGAAVVSKKKLITP